MLENQIKQMLLEVVRGVIYGKLYNKVIIDKKELIKKFPNFSKRAATFVTLTLDGKLRGCIGSLVAHKALLDDLTLNAYKAAFDDPRFPPLNKDEFERVDVEISILSQPMEVIYINIEDLKSKVKVGVDGMIIRQKEKQATFLPQVWEQLPNFEDFLTHLFQKAGITEIETPIEVFVYQVEKIK